MEPDMNAPAENDDDQCVVGMGARFPEPTKAERDARCCRTRERVSGTLAQRPYAGFRSRQRVRTARRTPNKL